MCIQLDYLNIFETNAFSILYKYFKNVFQVLLRMIKDELKTYKTN